MKLHGSYTSPYVRHCRIALAETGLDFEFVETDYAQSARLSPTRRVPFLHDGDLMLTDSTSILKYIRESGGQPFFPDVRDYDLFALANTALDSSVNLFLLEKDGVTPEHSNYLQRQADRVADALAALESRVGDRPGNADSFTDGELRLGCFLSWGEFRQRLTPDDHPGLARFLNGLNDYRPFAATHPTARHG